MNEQHLRPHRYLGGTEMEYPLYPIYADGHDYIPKNKGDSTYASAAFAQLPKRLGTNEDNGFASTGARIYEELGEKLEYCTPECTSYIDTVHSTIAGERTVVAAAKKAAQATDELKDIQILGRVIDNEGETWGYHENYLVSREAFDPPERLGKNTLSLQQVMLAHFATRSIFTGAGLLVCTTDRGVHVRPAQKVPRLQQEVTYGTTGTDKGLYNMRDESLTISRVIDKKRARLHVTNGDYVILPEASWLKTGCTAICAYLGEIGYLKTSDGIHLPPNRSLRIAKRVGRDADSRFVIPGTDHNSLVSAVDVQEKLCTLAQKFDANYPGLLTSEDKIVLSAWQRTIDDFRWRRENLLFKIDWLTRQHILEQYDQKRGPLSFKELQTVEKAWDDLAVSVGINSRDKASFNLYNPREIRRLQKEPTIGSRVEVRGRLIGNHYSKNTIKADWEYVSITPPSGRSVRVRLSDPFQTHIPAHTAARLAELA